MKNYIKILILGLISGFIGAYIFLEYFSDNNLANVSQTIVSTPSPEVIVYQGPWEKVISESSLKSVAVQVFQNNKAVRQGTGIILSSDGLIATTADLYAQEGLFQVFYEDKIIKANMVASDYPNNLILLKAEGSYFNVAELKKEGLASGQEIALVGKTINLSKPVIFSQKGLISYVTDKAIALDTVSGNLTYGAGVIDFQGKFLGISYTRGEKVYLIKGDLIENIFKDYTNR